MFMMSSQFSLVRFSSVVLAEEILENGPVPGVGDGALTDYLVVRVGLSGSEHGDGVWVRERACGGDTGEEKKGERERAATAAAGLH